MSPSPGPGQASVCHGRQGLASSLTNPMVGGCGEGMGWLPPQRSMLAVPLPRVAQEPAGLQERPSQRVPALLWP